MTHEAGINAKSRNDDLGRQNKYKGKERQSDLETGRDESSKKTKTKRINVPATAVWRFG